MPLLWPAISLMAGIWLAEATGPVARGPLWLTGIVPLAGLAGLIAAGRVRRRRSFVLPVLCIMAIAVGFARQQATLRHPADHVSRTLGDEPVLTRVVGEVITRPCSAPGELRNPFLPFTPPPTTRFVVALRELRAGDAPQPITGRVRVRVDADGLDLHSGDCVELTGKLFRPRGPRNPGEPDWARVSELQGIDAGLAVEGARYVRRLPPAGGDRAWSLARVLHGLRRAAAALLLEPGADNDAEDADRLLNTMVLGQRGAAGHEINEAFLRAGGMHFLAVSGFHVGVLAFAVWWPLRRVLGFGGTTAALATLPVILLYALIAEPNAPVLRATVAAVIAALAVLGRRPFCVVNWLSLAAIGILTYNPRELFRPGFQLSFVQVLALVILAGRVYGLIMHRRRGADSTELPPEPSTFRGLLLQRLGRALVGLLVLCVVAWCTSLPLVLLHFGRCAPWGIPGTLLLTVPVAATICLSFLTVLLRLLLWPAGAVLGLNASVSTGGDWLGAPVRQLSQWLLETARLFENLPGAVLEVQPPPALTVFLAYGVLLALVWLLRGVSVKAAPAPPFTGGAERYRWMGVAVAIALYAVLPLRSFLPVQPAPGECNVHVLAVGNGNAVLVAVADGNAALCDVGSIHNTDAGLTVARAMRTLGYTRLQDVYISHANFDHYSGVPSLLKAVPAKRLCYSPHFAEAAAAKDMAKLTEMLPPETPPAETVSAGQRRTLGPLPIEVLWPPADLDPQAWSANDRSLVLRVHAGGRTVLLPGDIEEAAMRALLAAEAAGRLRLSADVLIAAHHGSVAGRETATFLAAVDPEVIVVSSATPRPAFDAVVRKTLGRTPRVFNTRDTGAVTVTIKRTGDVVVSTPFAEPAPP